MKKTKGFHDNEILSIAYTVYLHASFEKNWIVMILCWSIISNLEKPCENKLVEMPQQSKTIETMGTASKKKSILTVAKYLFPVSFLFDGRKTTTKSQPKQFYQNNLV
jgi:hypothetical protein